jgi:hypothetical protein
MAVHPDRDAAVVIRIGRTGKTRTITRHEIEANHLSNQVHEDLPLKMIRQTPHCRVFVGHDPRSDFAECAVRWRRLRSARGILACGPTSDKLTWKALKSCP